MSFQNGIVETMSAVARLRLAIEQEKEALSRAEYELAKAEKDASRHGTNVQNIKASIEAWEAAIAALGPEPSAKAA